MILKEKLFLIGLAVGTKLSATTSGKNLVWEETTNILTKSISGPVALGFGTICIVATGFAWAFSKHGEGLGSGLRVAIATGIALGASSIIAGLYSFSSSAIF